MTAKDRQQYIQFINFLQLEGLLDEDRNMIIPYEIVDRYAEQQVKNYDSLDNVSVSSFSEEERDRVIDEIELYNAQNLNGRETEEQLYKQGISDAFDYLTDKSNSR